MKKVALFAFNGEPMCFAHVLLNGIDLHENGYDVKIIIEGTATKQVKELADEKKPFANLYSKIRDLGLIDCVCKACAAKTGSLEAATQQALPICDEMTGHPSIRRYSERGYEVISF
ncbi:cytoplasmic protein [candidate division KSB1 bacterium 4572_119]|nr:MAG: cytoplasmic protein [candidate division KSB1 bacterium 4572_119]